MTYDTINDAVTIAGNAEGDPSAEKGTPMDRSIGDGPTMRPKEERGGRVAFAPGDVIAGRYVVEKVLGEGGMGIVYQCLDKVGGVSVAVKCLPPEVSRNADEMEDIRANYRLVADLHHPNIAGVRTLELDESTDDYYLVMDLARGTSLKRWMRRNPQATMEAKLAILRQVAAALDYAHAQKVIHRDVKPENVMVDDEGIVKVLDFGLAAQIRSSQSRTSAAVTSRGGTPGYKSPEQWRGKPQREQSDVYSFGVMAYWMFAGVLPFDGDDPVVLGHAVLTEPVEPIAGIPAHMNVALAKALAKQPNERFASCGAVVGALEGKDFSRVEHVERVEGENGRARSPSGPQSVGSRVPRERTGGPRPVAAVKGILVAVLIAALAGGAWWLASGRNGTTGTTGTSGTTGTNVVHVSAVPSVSDVPSSASPKPVSTPKPIPPKAGPTDADVKAIAVDAGTQEELIKGIEDEQGYFKERKDELTQKLARARTNRNEHLWVEAAQGFTNYVNECKALLTLDNERQTAKESKTKAEKAKAIASKAHAAQYAEKRWGEACVLFKDANDLFGEMSFTNAVQKYKDATEQFNLCVGEANREQIRRAKWRKEGEPFTINDPYGLNMTMKWCPATTSDEWKRISGGKEYFTMGSPPSEEGRDNDERQHEVTLTKGFWMGQTEVTQGQWKKIMGGETVVDLARKGLQDDTLYNLPGGKKTLREFWGMTKDGDPYKRCGELNDAAPVYNVSWDEANRFCRILTAKERAEGRIPDGYEYRLPTEAEWEYACRAGETASLPNGKSIRILGENNAPALDDIAWYGGNSSNGYKGRHGWDTEGWKDKQYPGGTAGPCEVKGRQPNNWGLYDMIGNVWEWCGDWYGAYPYGSATDPTGAATGAFRVLRGGSWIFNARYCRSAFRVRLVPGFRSHDLGFRVALAPSH